MDYKLRTLTKRSQFGGSDANLARYSTQGGVGLHGCRSMEDLQSTGDLRVAAVIEQRNRDAWLKDLATIQAQPAPVTREAATKTTVHSAVQALRAIKLCEEWKLRDLYSTNPQRGECATVNSKAGRAIKAGERRLNKLQFHLMTLERLQEDYELHASLRHGSHKMLATMKHGGNKTTGVAYKQGKKNLMTTSKNISEDMCRIEHEIEQFLGKWQVRADQLTGFSLLMPGEEYKLTVKFGSQKWKTRVKLGKQNVSEQTWTSSEAVFFPVIGGRFHVKLKQLKGRLKLTNEIGSHNMESSDMFSAESQNITIGLTLSGALKMRLVVDWCWSLQNDNFAPLFTTVDKFVTSDETSSSGIGMTEFVRGDEYSSFNSDRSRNQERHLPANRLLLAAVNLAKCVDQVYGHFTTLHNLEQQVRRMVSVVFADSDSFNSIGFLQSESAVDEVTSQSSHSTNSSRSSAGSDSSGVNALLLTHIYSCLPLFKSLDSPSPLKKKRKKSLDALAFHAAVFEKILRLVEKSIQPENVTEVIPEMARSPQILKFWDSIPKDNPLLASNSDVMRRLDEEYCERCAAAGESDLRLEVMTSVVEVATQRLVGHRSRDDTSVHVSAFMVHRVLADLNHSTPVQYLDRVKREVQLNLSLQGDVSSPEEFWRTMPVDPDEVPHADNWRQLSYLFSDAVNTELGDAINHYLESLDSNVVLKRKVTGIFIEQLEEIPSRDVSSAAICLASMRASESLAHLAYLANCHQEPSVRHICRDAAFEFGVQGKNMVHFYENPINHLSEPLRQGPGSTAAASVDRTRGKNRAGSLQSYV